MLPLLLSIQIFGNKYDIRLMKGLIKNDGISKRGSQELKNNDSVKVKCIQTIIHVF